MRKQEDFDEVLNRVVKKIIKAPTDHNLRLYHVKESAIPAKKLEMRYNKVVVRLRERIELNLPIVLTNANKLKELHEMRKDRKNRNMC